MAKDLAYYMLKFVFPLLIWILPVEFICRFFWLVPGRLVIDILRWYGAEIGENVRIMPPIIFNNFHSKPQGAFRNLHIGANTHMGRDCFVDLKGNIFIHNNVTIAMGVTLITHIDVADSSVKKQFPKCIYEIVIKHDAYIGARTNIIAPVVIGSSAVIGAGSLAIHDVPENSVSVGVPAKVIRYLDM
jgi:acetyltransferase-like isoleucine patch superfamily enzyme